jgi:RNA polymerase sigma-70 factor (ECF subfamily)
VHNRPSPPQTWSAWLEANGRRFLLFARDQTRCEADAYDVLQEALVEAWQRSGHGDTTQPPDNGLVFATIRRRAIDLARRNDRRERRESIAQPTNWFQPSEAYTELDTELAQAVKALPPNLREVVVLKVWSGLTFQEIAGTLGLPLNTAASRYRYALERLRETMKELRP